MTQRGIEHQSPEPLKNTVRTELMGWFRANNFTHYETCLEMNTKLYLTKKTNKKHQKTKIKKNKQKNKKTKNNKQKLKSKYKKEKRKKELTRIFFQS